MTNKGKSRILFLNTSGDIGGGEISLANSLVLLDKRLYDVSVACPDGPYAEMLRTHHIRTWSVKINLLKPIRLKFLRNRLYLFNPFSILYNIILLYLNGRRLYNILKMVKPQIIHANTLEAVGIILIPALLSKASIIWHMRILPRMNSPTTALYINILARFTKRVIAVSEAVKERLIYLGVLPEKIQVIYNPVDTKTFHPCDRNRCREIFNLPKDSIILGSFGRLNPDKGFETFLKAAAIIVKKYNQIIFLIAGKEWERNYSSKLITLSKELGLSENFILLDWQANACALICSVDILLLLPTEYEAFPRTLAEAMACEIPVIGSNIGGITELIEHDKDGLIVPAGSAAAAAEAVYTLLRDKTASNRMARNGRHKVRTMLHADQHLVKISRIYAELTQEN